MNVKKIIFDVGANNGGSNIDKALYHPNNLVFAFEPTPEMIEVIKSKTSHLRNYVLIEKAVSDYDGTAKFNVVGTAGWGCSSLLDFSNKSKKKWPGRTQDFKVTNQIDVDVIRLETFIREKTIPKIDYLHIDTQGSDLQVLKGLGDLIRIVRSGVVEAGKEKDILYKGQNTLKETISFLESNGFEITELESNDPYDNEINVHFRNKNPKWIQFKSNKTFDWRRFV